MKEGSLKIPLSVEAVLGVSLLALTALSGPWAQSGNKESPVAQAELKAGMPAPDFTAPSSEGGTVSLHDFKGKVVVLYFYPKDNTPHCTKEACSFRDGQAQLRALGAVVLGVSKDSLDSHHAFTKKYSLNFPLLSDPEGKIITEYGSWKKGSIFGKTALGLDRSTFVIDREGIIRKIWRGVDVSNHEAEVLAFVKTLTGSPS